MGHADPVGFHGMSLAVIIIPNITWKQKGVDHQFLERESQPSHWDLGDLFLLQQWLGSPTFPAQAYPWIRETRQNETKVRKFREFGMPTPHCHQWKVSLPLGKGLELDH